MAKEPHRSSKDNFTNSASKKTLNSATVDITNTAGTSGDNKLKRRRRRQPDDQSPAAAEATQRRSSAYRGVTRHRWTGRFEAHLWDKDSWNIESQKIKKGKQVYLGAYDDEANAARTYDLAALKYWGRAATLNFPRSTYEKELKEMEEQIQTREEYIGSLRRKSSGFSRGVSKYRGVASHSGGGSYGVRLSGCRVSWAQCGHQFRPKLLRRLLQVKAQT